MYTTNDLEFPQVEIFEDCSRAPPPPEPTNTRRASPISPRPSSAISPRHFLSRSLKSILVPQKAHIIHISQISPRQFHSYQGPLLYNSVGRVYRTKNTYKPHFWADKNRQHPTLGGPGGQTIDSRSTSGLPLKSLGYNGSNFSFVDLLRPQFWCHRPST